VSLEMHLEATIVRTWRPLSLEFGDALGGRDQVELRVALGGHGRECLEMHLEAEI